MSFVRPFPYFLEVLLNDYRVGTLTWLTGDAHLFSFDDEYISNAMRPTLSLSFKKENGDLKTDVPKSGGGRLPPFFSNLLPEGHLRQYLAKKSNIKTDNELFLIGMLGEDLPGAVVVRPFANDKDITDEISEITRYETAQSILRFSLAGVQLKFSAIMDARGGLTIPANGVGGKWIAKLPSFTYTSVPENEFSMMRLAREIGIETPDVQLIPTQTIAGLPAEFLSAVDDLNQTLIVKRFDRDEAGRRIHIEDMAQVFDRRPYEKYDGVSYGNIAKLLWLEAGEESLVAFIRRLVFNAAIGNADMHLKNWSLIYPDGRTPTLAPAYDLVSTIAYINDDAMALSLGGDKRMLTLDKERFERMASKADLPQRLIIKTALDTVEHFREVWTNRARDLPMDESVQKNIEKHFTKIPLFQPFTH